MPNRSAARGRRVAALSTLCLAAMLGGCVAAVVPAIVTGAVGNSVLRRHGKPLRQPAVAAAAPAPSKTTPVPRTMASPVPRAIPPIAVRPAPDTAAVDAAPPAPRTAPTQAPAVTSGWEAIARAMAKMAARVPDPMKIDVLAPRGAVPQRCGTRPAAMVIDTATLGTGDYLYVGALYTMGLEIVLTSPLKQLPPGQVAALRRQGIAAPVAGKTLFPGYPGAERSARAAIAKLYCVVGLVGNRAADFPDGVLPGTPGARDGRFLVRR